MSTTAPRLLLSTSPFLKQTQDTAWIMWQVNYALAPVVLASIWFFGPVALLVIAASTTGALLPEWLLSRSKGERPGTLANGSAVITGVLLGLTLPPAIPLWIAFVGGFVAIAMGKLMFGGLGANIFNPALLGRAFLQAAFPVAVTTWSAPGQGLLLVEGSTLTPPFLKSNVDAVSAATPLASMKFDGAVTEIGSLLFGSTAGSLGETSAALILLCGVYLAARNVLNWRIPFAIVLTVGLFAGVLHLFDPSSYASPAFHLLGGGLMLGAVFMATDPVTSPITQRGAWVFGVGIGVLVVVIRTFGGLPEGVMYAILLMNGVTPLINRATQPRTFGTSKRPLWRS